MSLWVSAGGGLAEVKDLFVSAGGGNQKLAKVYESNGSGLSEIWSGMGKKWLMMFGISGGEYNNTIQKIDPDNMNWVSTFNIPKYHTLTGFDSWVDRRGQVRPSFSWIVSPSGYDNYGNFYGYSRIWEPDDEGGAWGGSKTFRMDTNGNYLGDVVRQGISYIRDILYVEPTTLDLIVQAGSSLTGASYYIEKYATSNNGQTYNLVFSTYIPYLNRNDVVTQPIITRDYIFFASFNIQEDSGWAKTVYKRRVFRINRDGTGCVFFINNSKSGQTPYDYAPVGAHPTLPNHFYSINLFVHQESGWDAPCGALGMKVVSTIQHRDENGNLIAAITIPTQYPLVNQYDAHIGNGVGMGRIISMRVFETHIICICENKLYRVALDLSSYTYLCTLTDTLLFRGKMDTALIDDYYIYCIGGIPVNQPGQEHKPRHDVGVSKYDYAGNRVGLYGGYGPNGTSLRNESMVLTNPIIERV